jgi:hypothetical protein
MNTFVYTRIGYRRIYRVFHDLWKLLQEIIPYVYVIKKSIINMWSILNGYGLMGDF